MVSTDRLVHDQLFEHVLSKIAGDRQFECMAFQRTRIINGRPYTYWEERYREKGKVKSRHLGKVVVDAISALVTPIPDEERGWAYIERQIELYPGDPIAEKAAEQQTAMGKLSKELGVTFPKDGETVTPVEKSAPEAPAKDGSQSEAASGEEKE